jgi:hypothetical protein
MRRPHRTVLAWSMLLANLLEAQERKPQSSESGVLSTGGDAIMSAGPSNVSCFK